MNNKKHQTASSPPLQLRNFILVLRLNILIGYWVLNFLKRLILDYTELQIGVNLVHVIFIMVVFEYIFLNIYSVRVNLTLWILPNTENYFIFDEVLMKFEFDCVKILNSSWPKGKRGPVHWCSDAMGPVFEFGGQMPNFLIKYVLNTCSRIITTMKE